MTVLKATVEPRSDVETAWSLENGQERAARTSFGAGRRAVAILALALSAAVAWIATAPC